MTIDAPAVGPTQGEATIYAIIGLTHTDLVIPRWAFDGAPDRVKAAVAEVGGGDWIVVGWGPYWLGKMTRPSDTLVRGANLAFSLLTPQQRSRLRLVARPTPGGAPDAGHTDMVAIQMSSAGLARAVRRIDQALASGQGGAPVVTYRPPDAPNVAVFLSDEPYSIAHQCDHWVGEVLRAGGVDVPPGIDFSPALLAVALKTALPAPDADLAASAGSQTDAAPTP